MKKHSEDSPKKTRNFSSVGRKTNNGEEAGMKKILGNGLTQFISRRKVLASTKNSVTFDSSSVDYPMSQNYDEKSPIKNNRNKSSLNPDNSLPRIL